MNDRLVLEFLGIDLISNVANDIAGSLDRLGTRFDRLGALGDSNFRSLVNATRTANFQMRAELLRMAEAERINAEEIAKWRRYIVEITKYYADLEAAALLRLQSIKDAIYLKDARGRFVSKEAAVAQQMEYIHLIETEGALQIEEAKLTKTTLTENAIRDKSVADSTRFQMAQDKLKRDSMIETARVQVESHQRMIQSYARFGQVMASVGVAAIGTAAAIGAGMVMAVKHAADFQAQMTLIETQAGAPRKGDIVAGKLDPIGEIARVQQRVLDLLPLFGVTGDEAAKAMYHVESLGFRGDRAMEILTAGLRGAKLGLADIEDTVNVLGTVMASGISGVKNATDAMAQLDAFVGVGNMRMQDLNDAFRSGIIGAAQNFGVSLKDVGAGLATLTDLGMPAALAGTRLRMSMTLLGAPANAAAKILGTLGLTEEEATAETTAMWRELEAAGVHVTKIGETMRTQGLIPALQLMKDSMTAAGLNADQQAAVISRAFGGGRSGAAIMTLIENMDRLKLRFNDISRLQNSFEQRWIETTKTTKFVMDQLHGAFDKFIIELGLVFMPTVLGWIRTITDVVSAVGTWIDKNGALLASLAPVVMTVLAAIGAFLLIGGAALMVGAAVGALGGFALPLIVIIGGVILVGKLLIEHWKDVTAFANKDLLPMWEHLQPTLRAVWGALEVGYKVFIPQLLAALQPLGDAISRQGGWWDQWKGLINGVIDALGKWVRSESFARLVAWLAVDLPAGIKIAVVNFLLFIDTIALVVHLIGGFAKAMWQFMGADFKGAYDTMTATMQQNGKDQIQIQKDNNAILEADQELHSKKTVDAYNNTLAAVRIAVDDGLRPLPGQVRTNMDAMQKVVDDMKEPMRQSGHSTAKAYTDEEIATMGQGIEDGKVRVIAAQQALFEAAHTAARGTAAQSGQLLGGDLALGVASGINAAQWQAEHAMTQLVQGTIRAGRDVANAYSPSRLFAQNLGVPIGQGIAMGILATGAQVNAAVQKVVADAANSGLGGGVPVSIDATGTGSKVLAGSTPTLAGDTGGKGFTQFEVKTVLDQIAEHLYAIRFDTNVANGMSGYSSVGG